MFLLADYSCPTATPLHLEWGSAMKPSGMAGGSFSSAQVDQLDEDATHDLDELPRGNIRVGQR
jgi:hypothetical protein